MSLGLFEHGARKLVAFGADHGGAECDENGDEGEGNSEALPVVAFRYARFGHGVETCLGV